MSKNDLCKNIREWLKLLIMERDIFLEGLETKPLNILSLKNKKDLIDEMYNSVEILMFEIRIETIEKIKLAIGGKNEAALLKELNNLKKEIKFSDTIFSMLLGESVGTQNEQKEVELLVLYPEYLGLEFGQKISRIKLYKILLKYDLEVVPNETALQFAIEKRNEYIDYELFFVSNPLFPDLGSRVLFTLTDMLKGKRILETTDPKSNEISFNRNSRIVVQRIKK